MVSKKSKSGESSSEKVELDVARLAKHAREAMKAGDTKALDIADRAVSAIARSQAAKVEAATLAKFLNDM